MFSYISTFLYSFSTFFYSFPTFLYSFFDTLFFELGLITLVLPFLADIDSICHHLHLLYAFITGFPVHFWLWVESIVWREHFGESTLDSTRRIPLIDSSLVFVAENQRLIKERWEHEKSKPWPMTWMEIQDMGYRMEKGEYGMVCYETLIRTDHLLRSPFSTSTSPTTVLYHSPSSSLPTITIPLVPRRYRSSSHQHIVVVVPRSHHRDDPYLLHRPALSRTVIHRHPSSLPSPSLFSLVVIDHHRRSHHPTSLVVTHRRRPYRVDP